MDLIERYIYAVTKQLPLDQRDDVADELRDSIQNALEEKGSHSKNDVKAVLTELGNPNRLAQSYKGGPQYLIGPDMYPFYIGAMKLTFAIGVPIVLFGGVISQIVDYPGSIMSFIFAVVGILVYAALHMLFWVTLVFFIFERTNVAAKELRAADSWDPSMLPNVKADRQIPASEAISDIVWYSFLVILPFIAQPFIGAHLDSQTTPFFNPEIGMIWSVAIITLGLIGILKGILKLRLRNWTPGLAAFNVIFALAFSAVIIALPVFTQIVNPAFATLLDKHIDTATLTQINQTINWTVGISIVITVGIYLYDAFNSIRLSRRLKK